MGARWQSDIDNNGALYKVSQSGEREHLEWFHHKKKYRPRAGFASAGSEFDLQHHKREKRRKRDRERE